MNGTPSSVASRVARYRLMTFDEEEQGKLRDGDTVALELVRDEAFAAMGGDPELQKELADASGDCSGTGRT